MHISKTIFKNLSRCHNFISLYDLYINRGLHNIKEIEGNKIEQDIEKTIFTLKDNLFDVKNEKIEEIFQEMFDEKTGDDLLNITNAQMEAFAKTFTEVERLATCYIEKVFQHQVVASVNTYKQKKYSYKEEGNLFYCYLDAYFEDEKTIKIFEVKATTSRKYDDFCVMINKKPYYFFVKDKDNIIRYQDMSHVFDEKEKMRLDKKQKILLDRYSDVGKYIYDISVQRHIIENSLKQKNSFLDKKIEYYLVVLNANYTFNGKYDCDNKPLYDLDENGEALFKIYDMNDLSKLYLTQIEEEKQQILKREKYLTIGPKCLGKHCEYKKTTMCKFCKVCMKEVLQDGSILEYLKKQYAFSKPTKDNKKKYYDVFELINQGFYKIDDVKTYLNKKENLIQYDCYINNEIYIDKARMKEAIKKIKYPVYYLDFESYNCPLPRFKGEHPYTQSLFQYSLHVEKALGHCDCIQDHFEYLAKDHQDHRLELIESLIAHIDLTDGGTVIVYNKSFEKTRLKELSFIFKDKKDQLDKINDHIFDLLEVLRGSKELFSNTSRDKPSFTYYNNLMHGSFSIKKVLPLFTNLTYTNLDVKNGTEAILTYGMLPFLTTKEYQEKYVALRIYCRQDTWAMVEILKGIREQMKNKVT